VSFDWARDGGHVKLGSAAGFARTGVRSHVFAAVLVAGVLIGGGLRYLPADAASATDPGAQEVAGSTACAAQ
jgi:hypothetical protein